MDVNAKLTRPPRPIETLPGFGQQLRAAREATGYPTQAALALKMGWTPEQQWKLESRIENPLFGTVRRLVEEAGLPLERFFAPEAILAAAARLKGA